MLCYKNWNLKSEILIYGCGRDRKKQDFITHIILLFLMGYKLNVSGTIKKLERVAQKCNWSCENYTCQLFQSQDSNSKTRQDSYLAHSRLLSMHHKKLVFFMASNKSFTDQACWPRWLTHCGLGMRSRHCQELG